MSQLDGISMEVRTTAPEVPERLRRLEGMLRRPERAFRSFAQGKVRRIRESFQRAPKGESAPAGRPPFAHTRDFSRSIVSQVASDGHSVTIGTVDVRGRILQEGGVIRPVKAKALAIPISEKAYGKRPRDFADLVRKGHFLVREIGGKRSRSEMMFLLTDEVEIKEHPWLVWEDEDTRMLGHELEDQADREVGIG